MKFSWTIFLQLNYQEPGIEIERWIIIHVIHITHIRNLNRQQASFTFTKWQ